MRSNKSKEPRTEVGNVFQRREICGYVAIAHHKDCGAKGWIYFRKHASDTLFVGNLPWPSWLPFERTISEDAAEKLKGLVKKLVPGALTVTDVFSTGNGRLAARVSMKDEGQVTQVLQKPWDHVYLAARDEMMNSECLSNTSDDAVCEVLERWLNELERERDSEAVRNWSDAAMRAFETRERLEKEAREMRAKKAAEPDEDGFVTVTNGPPQMKASEAAQTTSLGRGGKGKKSSRKRKRLLDAGKGIEKTGFYRWQRENENSLLKLRDKFREDRKRVAAIRGLGQGNRSPPH